MFDEIINLNYFTMIYIICYMFEYITNNIIILENFNFY